MEDDKDIWLHIGRTIHGMSTEGSHKGGRLQDTSNPEAGYWRTDFQHISRALVNIAEKEFPELLKLFYPRQYPNLGQYHSPRQLAANLAMAVVECARMGYDKSPTAYRLLMPALAGMVERHMPIFFIAPDLLEAVKRTDFSDEIDWTEMKLPYEQGVFILPRGSLRHPPDKGLLLNPGASGDISAIVWARYRQGMDYTPVAMNPLDPLRLPVMHMNHDMFSMLGLSFETGIWYDSVFNAKTRSTVKLRNLFYRESGERAPSTDKGMFDEDLTENDEPFLEEMGVIGLGTLLAMNARPDLIERGRLLRKVVKSKDDVKEFWSPNIIGPRYKFRREVPKISKFGEFVRSQPQGGSHASPREHWRRGHFRNQPYGPGLREHRHIWIEPCIVARLLHEKKTKEAAAE